MTLANGRVDSYPSSVDENWTVKPAIANAQADEDAALNPDANALIESDPAQPDNQAPSGPELTEVELIAKEQGWVPQSEWTGDPSKWVPAADHLRNTRRILDERQNQLREARRQNQRADQAFEREMARRMAALEANHAAQTKAQLDAQARRIHGEYELLKKQAIKDGDERAYDALEAEKQELLGKVDEARQETMPRQAPQVDYNAIAENIMTNPASLPEKKFITERHAWLLSDDADAEEAFEAAINAMNEAAERGMPKVDQLAYAENTLRFLYPARFAPANPSREMQATEAEERAARAAQQNRAPNGQFAAQQAQQAVRRPPPAIAAANRAAQIASGDPDIVIRAQNENPKAMAEWEARSKAGTTKMSKEDWAAVALGERTNVL